MAFCKYCGNQLNDGELCTCEKAVAAQAAAQPKAEEVVQTQAEETAPEAAVETEAPVQATEQAQSVAQAAAPSQAQAQGSEFVDKTKAVVSDIFGKLLAIWKKPADEGAAFTNTENHIDAIIFVAIQAILAGFLGMAQLKKMEAVVTALITSISASLSSLLGGEAKEVELPYGQTFFYMLLGSVVISALLFVVYYLLMKIMKVEVKPKQLLCYVSLGSVAAIPFTVVALIFTFMNQGIGLALFALSVIFSFAYMMQAGKAFTDDENKKTYLVALANTVVVIIIALFAYSKIGSMMEEAVSGMSSMFSYML